MRSEEAGWDRLPARVEGNPGPLPAWAEAIAAELPRTAAAMLELDFAQRAVGPLEPGLRSSMRWVVAHANRSAYGETYALADLERAGGTEHDAAILTGDPASWPDSLRDPLEFARLLTVDAPSIPDALFDRLVERFGAKGAAAMVLLGAYANFQDRVVLGLDLAIEEEGPLAPIAVRFAPGALQSAPLLAAQPELPEWIERGESVVPAEPEWSSLSYELLQARLESQRDRRPRLPIPSWDEVKRGLPPEMATHPTRIVWSLVCSGYVPELALPWARTTRTLWSEAQTDRVFEESLFWIQTRAIGCNYCMGHCEMLLEVAGLDKAGVADRTRRLGSDDWSGFPPREQRALGLARRLSVAPWTLSPGDLAGLGEDFGPRTAMATFLWLCRGLYMTRVSDGFQLPLERENVFADAPPSASPTSTG